MRIWEEGKRGRGGEGGQNNSFFPMPHAQCPMPIAQCPMPITQLLKKEI